MYFLVEFINSNDREMAIVPDLWVRKDQEGYICVYPTRFMKPGWVFKKKEPEGDWANYPVRVLYKNDNFKLVQTKQKEAEDMSEVGTTDGEGEPQLTLKKRQAPVPARYQQEDSYASSSGEEEDTNPPKRYKKKTTELNLTLPQPPRFSDGYGTQEGTETQDPESCLLIAPTGTTSPSPRPSPRFDLSGNCDEADNATPGKLTRPPAGRPSPHFSSRHQSLHLSEILEESHTRGDLTRLPARPSPRFSPRKVYDGAEYRAPVALTRPSASRPSPRFSPREVFDGSEYRGRYQTVGTPPRHSRYEDDSYVTKGEMWALLKESMERQETMLFKIEEQGGMLRRLLADKTARTDCPAGPPSLPEGFVFPLQVEDMARLQDFLADKAKLQEMVAYCTTIGGAGTRLRTRKILQALLSNKCAALYNYTGRGTKESFSALRLHDVVVAAVKKCEPEATNTELADIISSWLTSSGDRDGGRDERRKKAAQKN